MNKQVKINTDIINNFKIIRFLISSGFNLWNLHTYEDLYPGGDR